MSGQAIVSRPPAMSVATEADCELFERKLSSFVPPNSFDVHAHLYHGDHGPVPISGPTVDLSVWLKQSRQWMGDLAPQAGLFFGFPSKEVLPASDNELIAQQLTNAPDSRGLLLVRPGDDPDAVDTRVETEGWAGFKVYHMYANREVTFDAGIDEFLPQWMWEIADRRGLAIMLHMVRNRALADERNQREIRESCLRYPNAKLILAHAGRGMCADHTVEGIDALAGLDNIYFDTSAICEPGAFMAILQQYGTRRLMYGSDYPISQLRGRNVSVGDGFFWVYDSNADYEGWTLGEPTLEGIESLLALRQAARFCHLNDTDIQRIFSDNARQLLEITPVPTGAKTQSRYNHAKTLIPGGTQLLSKRPELHAPDAWPAYFSEAHGVEVVDLDGRRFTDMSTCGIGSTLLGFADPDVNAAVARRVMLGSMCTQNTEDEVELAELLIDLHPWSDQVRYARTGGEAMAVAVRIARAATGRDRVAICGYHGWQDWYLAANVNTKDNKALDGHLLPGLDPAGVPSQLTGTTLPFGYNKLEELEVVVKAHGNELAAIILEPLRWQEPDPGFHEGVRKLVDECGAVLMFDEITTGWRFNAGGAHLEMGATPDIAVFSKATGNGFAIAAVLGIQRVMEAAQQSFISSTMWTEGVGPAAALATIRKMIDQDVSAHVKKIGQLFQAGVKDCVSRHSLPLSVQGRPALSHFNIEHEQSSELMTLYTRLMLKEGFLATESFYPTFAHQPRHMEAFLKAMDRVLPQIADAIKQGNVMERIDHKPKHVGFKRLT